MEKDIIISKCYEVTYFSWWDVDHNRGDAFAETVYADTSAQAKYKFMVDGDLNSGMWVRLKVRRCKSMDLLRFQPHPIVSELTESQINKMKHAVGIETNLPCYGFYRNRYVIPVDPEWDNLIEKGLALKTNSTSGLEFYYLTQEGKNVITTLLPIHRYRKEAFASEKEGVEI